jgi:putative oxygen-independent coproporphyrinogen III oxidase
MNEIEFARNICSELTYMREISGQREITSIFFGGGTPSLMPPKTIDLIITQIANLWGISDFTEITMEANPTSIEAENFRAYRQAGVNRVSVGVQALNDNDLSRLGREHSSQEALNAFRLAREIFPRVSFDLIYARPQQTLADWEKELTAAIKEQSDHMSLYQLTIEEGTAYYDLHVKGKLAVPDQDHAASLYELTQDITTAYGLRAYEVSNHACPGEESKHNLIYWRYGEYVGVGPGAHGRLVVDGQRHSMTCRRDPQQWFNAVTAHGHGIENDEILFPHDQAYEYLIMGMRLSEGISLDRYEALSGKSIDTEILESLLNDNFITRSYNRIAATAKGRRILNAVISKLAGL